MVFSLFFAFGKKFTLFRALANDRGYFASAEATKGAALGSRRLLKKAGENFSSFGLPVWLDFILVV